MAQASPRRAMGGLRPFPALRCTAAAVVLSVVALAGCGLPGADYQYVHSSSAHTYVRLPKAWHVYNQQSVADRLKGSDPSSADDISKQYRYFTVFDGAKDLSLVSLTSLTASDLPHGQLWVRPLNATDHESVSFNSLNSLLLKDFDTLNQSGQLTILGGGDRRTPKGYWGRHIVYQLRMSPSAPSVVVDQTALVDSGATVLYLLFVTCSASCYAQHKNDFATVVNSWNITQE